MIIILGLNVIKMNNLKVSFSLPTSLDMSDKNILQKNNFVTGLRNFIQLVQK